jgi:DNA polymerase III delta subunit
MLYVITGNDFQKVTAKKQALIEAMHKKRPGAEVITFDTLDWSEAAFEEKAFAQGLFESKVILILNQLLSEKTSREYLATRLDALAALDHAVIMIEEELDEDLTDNITAAAEQVFTCMGRDKKETPPPNLFPLADALAQRNKKEAWVLFTEALRSGVAAEEIHGVLMWQVRSMLIAQQADSATNAGLKPFVYTKSKRYASNFPGSELPQLSEKLVRAYHDARRGEGSMADQIEAVILSI